MNPELPVSFPHTAPEGYSYETVSFKSNVVAIWIRNHYKFVYNGGGTTRSIWGFYNTKTKCFHSPINSKTVGDKVDISQTTPYSAMLIKQTPLERAFV
jgi:hypothetical protein